MTLPALMTSTLLPKEARNRLIEASKIKDEVQRRRAIDTAIDHVKRMNSNFFKNIKE